MLVHNSVAPSLAVRVYTERVVSLFDYVAQFTPMPDAMKSMDIRAAESLWRLPVRALPPAALRPLRALGWPLPPSMEARCNIAAAGAARRWRI